MNDRHSDPQEGDGPQLATKVYTATYGNDGKLRRVTIEAPDGEFVRCVPQPIQEEGGVGEADALHELLAHFRDERARLTKALRELQNGPDTLTQDGLAIVNRALYPANQPQAEQPEEGR